MGRGLGKDQKNGQVPDYGGFVNYYQEVGFFLKCCGKPLEGGKQDGIQCDLHFKIITLLALESGMRRMRQK